MSSQRQSIKGGASNWSSNLRRRCLQRAKERRQDWLNARRALGQEQAQEQVASEVQQLVRHQVQHSFSSNPRDADYVPPLDPDLLETLTRDMYLEIVRAELDHMQQLEEAEMAALAEAAEQQREMERQAGGVPPARGVLCPVCGRADLTQLHGIITCPVDGFQLDVRSECCTLEHVRHTLDSIHQAHHASGCRGRLTFSVEDWLGPKCMLVVCGSCELLQVVV